MKFSLSHKVWQTIFSSFQAHVLALYTRGSLSCHQTLNTVWGQGNQKLIALECPGKTEWAVAAWLPEKFQSMTNIDITHTPLCKGPTRAFSFRVGQAGVMGGWWRAWGPDPKGRNWVVEHSRGRVGSHHAWGSLKVQVGAWEGRSQGRWSRQGALSRRGSSQGFFFF